MRGQNFRGIKIPRSGDPPNISDLLPPNPHAGFIDRFLGRALISKEILILNLNNDRRVGRGILSI